MYAPGFTGGVTVGTMNQFLLRSYTAFDPGFLGGVFVG